MKLRKLPPDPALPECDRFVAVGITANDIPPATTRLREFLQENPQLHLSIGKVRAMLASRLQQSRSTSRGGGPPKRRYAKGGPREGARSRSIPRGPGMRRGRR